MNRNSVWFGLTASAQLVTDTRVTVILTLYLQHYFSQKVEVKKSAIQLLTATALPLLISCSCHNHVILLAATCCSFVLISPIINLSLSLLYLFIYFLPSWLMQLQFQGFWDRLGLQQWLQLKVKPQENIKRRLSIWHHQEDTRLSKW